MGWAPTAWMLLALVSVVAVVLFTSKAFRRRPARPSSAVRTAWLIGATTSGAMLLSIAVQVSSLARDVTAIDVGALAITGMLTGFFLALSLTPFGTHPTKS